MEGQSKGMFFIKAEYDGEICLLIDVQGVGPWKFTADRLIEGNKEHYRIEIDPEKIRFPSLSAISGCENLHKFMFFHLFNALSTSRWGDGSSRLNTGFGVIDGELDGIVNCPAEQGEKQLLSILFDRVSKLEVDWSTYFYFASLDENKKQGIGIDIMNTEQCYLFFIPIIFEPMEEGGLYFSLDVTLTELIVHGKGVELVTQENAGNFSVKNSEKVNLPEKTILDSGGAVSKSISTESDEVSKSKKRSSAFTKILIGLGVLFILSLLLNSHKKSIEISNKTVMAKSLRVRSEPSVNSSVINKLVRGDTVTVEKNQNDWSFISNDEVKGWVASEYLDDGKLQ